MKLAKTSVNRLCRTLESGGLLKASLHYEVTKAEGELEYSGPKIPPGVWRQITSFFKWANDTAQSEAQVRLFVSTKHNTWKAWAFPQEGHTGLSTKEIQNEEFKQQRAALFENDDDWTAWGTVHSHANVSAFQSGTDEADEKNQGGLHITVGDMGKAAYSIHARLYHQGDQYDADMSKFWDVGNIAEQLTDAYNSLSETARHYIKPPDISLDKIAREQMCIPVEAEFPPQWKANYKAPEPVKHTRGGLLTEGKFGDWRNDPEYERYWPRETDNKTKVINKFSAFSLRLDAAVEEILDISRMYLVDDGETLLELLDGLTDTPVEDITATLADYDVKASDVLGELRRRILANEQDAKQNGQLENQTMD